MQAEFIRLKPETDDIYSLWFSRPAGFSYQAGDYTELSLGSAGRRWLSLASAPSEAELMFTVRIGSPPSEFKSALTTLKPGEKVLLAPPMGNFNAPLTADKLLFMAGGIGITPFRSILLEEQAKPAGHDVALFYTAKAGQHLFQNELNHQSTRQVLHTSQSERLSLDGIKRRVPDLNQRLIYLAGPEPMMQSFYEELIAGGHPRWRLRLCYFPGYKNL